MGTAGGRIASRSSVFGSVATRRDKRSAIATTSRWAATLAPREPHGRRRWERRNSPWAKRGRGRRSVWYAAGVMRRSGNSRGGRGGGDKPVPGLGDGALPLNYAAAGRSAGAAGRAHRARRGTSAIARSGPPDPPSIFIGSATSTAPVGGSASRWARFSNPGTFRAATMRCTMKSRDWP